MKKVLTLSKEQARVLFDLLSAHNVPNRSDNRKRFRFLDVIEDFVFEYDDEIDAFKGKPAKEVKDELTKLSEETKKFTFADREVFATVKSMFEKCYETGTKSRDQSGKIIGSPLLGRNAKIYMQLEDRFADVVDIKENKKGNKK